MYLVFQPLGLGLDKFLFDWNSVRNMTPIYDKPSDEEEDEDYLPASQIDEESHIDDEEDGLYGDDLDGEGPTGGGRR